MEILILTMLWLITCILFAVIGFYFGLKQLPKQTIVKPEISEEEAKKMKTLTKELRNFYSYDGSEQG